MNNPTSKRPAFPGRLRKMKNLSDERGVSPVIAVILMVAITVVLASVLYVMVIGFFGDQDHTPTGAITFEETDPENGVYFGSILRISRDVDYKDVSVRITDKSTLKSATLNPLENNGIASTGEGQMNITYQDVNSNGKLDAADIFLIYNGEEGDQIVLSYKAKGQICMFTMA